MIEELIQLTKQAWTIAMKHHNTKIDVNYKLWDTYDPLTIADKEVDDFLRKWVKNLLDVPILSEEHDNKELDYTWDVRMIDPIDGTKDYVWWSWIFSIMIWLCRGWKPYLWVVYKPFFNTRYYAQRWKWSYKMVKWEAPKRLSTSTVAILSDARCVGKSQFSEPRESEDRIKKALWIEELQVWWTVWWTVWEIAEWLSDIYFFTNPRWWKRDICWPQVILEEAWGRVTDIQWNSIDYANAWYKIDNGFVASNGLLHEQALQVYKEVLL